MTARNPYAVNWMEVRTADPVVANRLARRNQTVRWLDEPNADRYFGYDGGQGAQRLRSVLRVVG